MSTDLSLPQPQPDADSAQFWDALGRHELLVQRCGGCGRAQLYFRAMCSHCWSRDLTNERASGSGTVYSVTTVHQAGHPALAGQTPYQLGLIDLDEGPRVLARLAGVDTRIGTRVRAAFFTSGAATLLQFEPAGSKK